MIEQGVQIKHVDELRTDLEVTQLLPELGELTEEGVQMYKQAIGVLPPEQRSLFSSGIGLLLGAAGEVGPEMSNMQFEDFTLVALAFIAFLIFSGVVGQVVRHNITRDSYKEDNTKSYAIWAAVLGLGGFLAIKSFLENPIGSVNNSVHVVQKIAFALARYGAEAEAIFKQISQYFQG